MGRECRVKYSQEHKKTLVGTEDSKALFVYVFPLGPTESASLVAGASMTYKNPVPTYDMDKNMQKKT